MRARNFTLRDIQDSLAHFDGTGSVDINLWIQEFEENAIAVDWDEIQMYIYAKQLLKGAAKLFVRSQVRIKSWDALKQALIKDKLSLGQSYHWRKFTVG